MNNQVTCPSLVTVLQICVGLSLGGVLGEQLIELAGYKLNASQAGYKRILYYYQGHSIYECEALILALGLPPIVPVHYKAS
jgi:hypothetical protein